MWVAGDMEEGVVVSSTRRNSGFGQSGQKVVERAKGLVWRAEDGSPRSASPAVSRRAPAEGGPATGCGGRRLTRWVTTLGGPVAVGRVV